MSYSGEETTKIMQDVELDILKEIDRVCKENHITYFASGGTFLGAVRHKGFIPWDNDIDIGMYRKDYEKFLKIAPEVLKEPYILHTYKNCKEHHYYMAHVVDTRYRVRRQGSLDQRIENIWVDIFPYDGLPNQWLIRNLHYYHMIFCRLMFHLAYFETVNITRTDRSKIEHMLIKLLLVVHRYIKPEKRKWRERIDILLKKCNLDDCEYIVNFIGIKGRKEIFSKKIFMNLKEYRFEDMKLLAPVDAKTVLSQLYGEYMKIPDEKDREVHPIELYTERG